MCYNQWCIDDQNTYEEFDDEEREALRRGERSQLEQPDQVNPFNSDDESSLMGSMIAKPRPSANGEGGDGVGEEEGRADGGRGSGCSQVLKAPQRAHAC